MKPSLKMMRKSLKHLIGKRTMTTTWIMSLSRILTKWKISNWLKPLKKLISRLRHQRKTKILHIASTSNTPLIRTTSTGDGFNPQGVDGDTTKDSFNTACDDRFEDF